MKKILIVNANYYEKISESLLKTSYKELKKNKFKVAKVNVPGIFEIPSVISKYINKYDGFLALGCVIKGETPHFELISKAVFNGIMSLSINSKKIIANGIVTANNYDQAKKRSFLSGKNFKKNKGLEAAKALIEVFKNEPRF